MIRFRVRAALALAAMSFAFLTPASAQQQPDLSVLQTTLNLTRNDRNQMMDALTEALARQQVLLTELAKAQARIKEIEAKNAPKPDAKPDAAPAQDKSPN